MWSTRYQRLLVIAMLACGTGGCGGEKPGRGTTADVNGRVTYRGVPLVNGDIKFIPVQAANEVRVAYGTLDDEGRYRLSTYEQNDGAILGDYRIVVEACNQLPVEEARRAAMLGGANGQPKSLIPRRYGDPNTSGLTASVKSGQNTLDIDLKD